MSASAAARNSGAGAGAGKPPLRQATTTLGGREVCVSVRKDARRTIYTVLAADEKRLTAQEAARAVALCHGVPEQKGELGQAYALIENLRAQLDKFTQGTIELAQRHGKELPTDPEIIKIFLSALARTELQDLIKENGRLREQVNTLETRLTQASLPSEDDNLPDAVLTLLDQIRDVEEQLDIAKATVDTRDGELARAQKQAGKLPAKKAKIRGLKGRVQQLATNYQNERADRIRNINTLANAISLVGALFINAFIIYIEISRDRSVSNRYGHEVQAIPFGQYQFHYFEHIYQGLDYDQRLARTLVAFLYTSNCFLIPLILTYLTYLLIRKIFFLSPSYRALAETT